MNDHTSSCDEIVASLILFNLFERLCAGFMKWGMERGDFNNEFKTFLDERKGKLRPPQASIRVSEQLSPLDTGLMPNALADYLMLKANNGPNELAFSNAKVKALTMYNEFQELISIRNKVMHGFTAPETSAQIAFRMASVIEAITGILGEHLIKISKQGVSARKADHTMWARLLFLTEKELLFIAGGKQLPTEGTFGPVISLPIESNGEGKGLTEFRKTDRNHKPRSSQLCLPEELTDYESLWVSTTLFRLDQLDKRKNEIRSLARSLLGLAKSPPRPYVSEINEGPDDVESDPFSIPWWKKAPEGKAYLCIAL